ncbi:MAG: hypothetical protein GXP03_09300, partial [Alphaproteobacteria bacterium]|nr:hypothetical protein [Alphaproteobacteria bacterium]
MSAILRTMWLMLALVYSAVAVLAQEPPEQKEQVWVVRHETEEGFPVPGFAVYDPKAGTLTLNYKPDKTPYDGRDFGAPILARDYYQVLVTKEITIDKDRLTAVFRGKNISPVFFNIINIGTEIPEDIFSAIDNFEEGAVELLDAVIAERVRLFEETAAFEISLNRKFDDERTLEGGWTYSADIFDRPFTGKEKWTKAGKIVDVIVLQDQKARNDLGRAAFPYPFGDDPEAKYRNKTTRRLFVVGTNLPNKGGQVSRIDSLDPALDYRIDAVQSDADEFGTVAADFTKGWAKFKERAGRSQGDLDGIIAITTLKEGVVAGPKGLVLNGSRGTWTLEFGDATGEMSFTRDRAVDKVSQVPKPVWNKSRNKWAATKLTEKRVETTEKTTIAYLYDEITVQIELQNSFPIDEFEVTLGPPATVQIDLKRTIGPASAASPVVVLKKSPENARLYRSEPLYIVGRDDDGQDRPKGPEGIILRVNTPGKLVAKLDDPGIFLVPPFSILELEGTPDEVGGSFIQALRQASKCYGNAPVVDWRKLSNQKAKDVSNVIITELGSRSIRLTFGDHAAMLLMRQEFLRQMAQARNTYATMLGNDALLVAFARTIDPVQFGRNSPIARMQVPNPENLN